MKLKATITVEWPVADLAHYQAETLQGAADLTKKQWDDGEIDPMDIVSWGEAELVKVEPING